MTDESGTERSGMIAFGDLELGLRLEAAGHTFRPADIPDTPAGS